MLRHCADIERMATRIALGSAKPREIGQLRDTLNLLPEIYALMENVINSSENLKICRENLTNWEDLAKNLSSALVEAPPLSVKEGGIFKKGFSEQLDELHRLSYNFSDYLSQMEAREQEKTGITTLKISFNRLAGFFIEIPRSQAKNADPAWIRRQTLKNNERYISEELKVLEEKVLNSQAAALELERKLYEELLLNIDERREDLYKLAQSLAEIDVCLAWAVIAKITITVAQVLRLKIP